MKKLFSDLALLSLILFLPSAFAAKRTLVNYDQLLQALEQGDNVVAVIQFEKCTVSDPSMKADLKKFPFVSGGFNFSRFSHYKEETHQHREKHIIATSTTNLTDQDFGPAYANARLRVFDDNYNDFIITYYDPKTYDKKMTFNFVCQINNDMNKNGGLALYDMTG